MADQATHSDSMDAGVATPRRGRVWRLLGWTLFALWLAFAAVVLVLRYAVLPQIGAYHDDIEQAASRALGQSVRIGTLQARWSGLNPELVLGEVAIADEAGQPAFSLRQVDAVLSWQTVLTGRLRLALLAVEGPVLRIERDTDGRISVAGIKAEGEGDPAALEWLLAQSHVRVRDATIVWEDKQRGAPPLILEDLQFGLDNRGRRHRFGFSAAPPAELASRLDLRGEIHGDVSDALGHFEGRLYVELDYADLAAWRTWFDYPVHLPRGRGALRLWGDLEDGEGKLTADVALEDLRLRLARHLPELDLASMRGRLSGRYNARDWEIDARRIELQTHDGVRVVPSDVHVAWHGAPGGKAGGSGELSASLLDLSALRRLAAHLPLEPAMAARLARHQPEGTVSDLKAKWQSNGESIGRYSFRAGFTELGLAAEGALPGARGLSGAVEGNEKGGALTLDARQGFLSLPAVFPEPDVPFDSLLVRSNWRVGPGGVLDVNLERLEVSSPDAAAHARGTYRYTGDGPGVIDLTANIQRGEGTAVWRYMPLAVNATARAWLRRGITGGRGVDGKMVLKGDLRDFPFRDPAKGTFYVTAKAVGARLDYADGWPIIENIDGDMRFGIGMQIKAKRGHILGADLNDVMVDLPDFESKEELLLIRGTAQGPTGEFLRFIDQSPVGQKIDNFTEGMKAVGKGKLELSLELPLQHLERSKVRGDYRFQGNQIQPLPGMPPITQVNGRLQFTEGSVLAEDIAGQLLGGPMKLRVKNEGDRVAVRATGQATIAAVRQHFGWPLMEQLGGGAAWKTDINIRKRNAEFVIESNLVGVSASLPEPLNKSASTPLPLRIERSTPDPLREQFRITLGKLARGSFILRDDGKGGSYAEKAALAVGEGEARLPEKGLNILVAQPAIDADAWKSALEGGASRGAAAASGGLALNQVSVRTPRLRLLGRDYHNVDVALRPREGGWAVALNMKEVQGEVNWRSAGDGHIDGRLRRVVIPESATGDDGAPPRLLDSLPGMNLSIDELLLGERALGQLDIQARNDKGVWQLDTISLKNPDFALKGKGSWYNGRGQRPRQATHLDFDLGVNDIGHALGRLGFDDAVRRGKARLTGAVDWDGGLTGVDYPSLSGSLKLTAEKGQFNKLEPGIGKLLGLLSLQSLPRRLTLDFRDIFSDGLAFDTIEGRFAVRRGILKTVEPLRIRGPAARIDMSGETDLKAETQDMQVVVRPEISTVAAVGAALVNPIAGAATLLGNSVLDSPINKLFSYRYHVTGTWSDPKVAKAGESAEPKPAESPKPTEEKP